MTKEFQKYEKVKDEVSSLLETVKRAKTDLKSHAPDELKEELNKFIQFLEGYDVEKLRPSHKVLTGEFFDFESLKEKITETTGYLWKVRELTDKKEIEEHNFVPERYEDQYGVTMDKIRVYEFYRDSKNRSELWLLQLVLFPGHAIIYMDTDRAGGASDICNSPDKIIAELQRFGG